MKENENVFIDAFPLVLDCDGKIPKRDVRRMKSAKKEFPNAKIQIVFGVENEHKYEIHLPETQEQEYYYWYNAYEFHLWVLENRFWVPKVM